jgi:predicted HAD superfamily Cof-like phosphohydrolase
VSNKFVGSVIHFNSQILGIAPRTPGMLSESEFKISVECLKEEVEEFVAAHNQGDYVGVIDAMIDLQYFAIGVMYKLGLNQDYIDEMMQAVHDANMTKKKGVKAGRGDGVAADAVKGADWVSPEQRIMDILDRTT